MKHQLKFVFLGLFVIGFVSCETEKTNSNNEGIEVLPENKLSQVSINTNGATIVDEPKIESQMTITVNDVVDFSGKIGIEITEILLSL